MRIPEIKEYLKTISPRRSVLILGAPGIGKSVMVREFAEEEARKLNLEFVDYSDEDYEDIKREPERYYVFADFRLPETEPSDLLGVPRDVNNAVIYKPLLWAKAMSLVRYGMIFLDELTNVDRPDLQSVAYKLVLDRKAGFVKFSDGVRIIAAGNRPDESAIAHPLPAPLTSRFHVIVADSPTIEEWSAWMDSHVGEWDKRVLGYLMRFREDFIKLPDEPETLEAYPTPRSWHWLAEELVKTPRKFWRPKAEGYVGREVATRFVAFLETPIPDPEDLIKKPAVFAKLSLDTKYLATVIVGNHYVGEAKVSPKQLVPFLRVAMAEGGEFLALFLMTIQSNREKASELLATIMTDKDYRDLAEEIGNLGWFMMQA